MLGVMIVVAAAAIGEPSEEPAPIVITGERVRRSLKETPSSVVVISRKDMERMAAPDRLRQLLEQVPNVLQPTARSMPTIRGQQVVGVLHDLPAFLGGARPRTALQIDGRTVTFNEFVNSTQGLWDVDRVEVFRTPQSTTQGVNSIAGAIFLFTGDPTFDVEGRAQLIAGGGQRRQASAVMSAPLAGDQLAVRIAGDVYRGRGTTRMEGPTAGIKDLNVDHYWTTRVKLLAAPHGMPGLRLLTTYAHTHAQAAQNQLARPPFEARHDGFYRFGYFKSDVDSITSTATYEFGSGIQSRTTGSFGRSHFRRFAPVGFGQTDIHGDDAAAETVLEWKPGGALTGVAGASFQRVAQQQFIHLERADLGTGSFHDVQRNLGVFGELTWQATERLSLTAGGRYQSDGKERLGVLHMTPDLPLDYNRTSHAFLPKLNADYDVSPGVRIGLLVQRAYNPGGTTLDPDHRKQLDFEPEYLWDFEAFTRMSLLGGRLSLNGNLFYNSIRNAQRQLEFDLSSPGGQVGLLQIISEPRARSYGAELELRARPTQRLSIMAGLGWLNTKITKGFRTGDPYVDREFAGAPSFTAAAGADWEAVRDVHLSAQVRREAAFEGDDSNDPLGRTSGFWIVDARASWAVGRLTLFAYGQNLFNTFRIIGWAGPRNIPEVEAEVTDPRRLGVGIEVRF